MTRTAKNLLVLTSIGLATMLIGSALASSAIAANLGGENSPTTPGSAIVAVATERGSAPTSPVTDHSTDPRILLEWWRLVVNLTASETQSVATALQLATSYAGDPATTASALCAYVPSGFLSRACVLAVKWKIGTWTESIARAAAENMCLQIRVPYLPVPLFWSVEKVTCLSSPEITPHQG